MPSQMLQLFLCTHRIVNISQWNVLAQAEKLLAKSPLLVKLICPPVVSNRIKTELQTKKLNLEKRLGYHFLQILNCNSLHSPSRLSLQSVTPLLFAVFILPSLTMFWAVIFIFYSIKWSVVPTVLKWFWSVIRLLIKQN